MNLVVPRPCETGPYNNAQYWTNVRKCLFLQVPCTRSRWPRCSPRWENSDNRTDKTKQYQHLPVQQRGIFLKNNKYRLFTSLGRSVLGKTVPSVLSIQDVGHSFTQYGPTYNTMKGVRKTRTFYGCNHGRISHKLNNF